MLAAWKNYLAHDNAGRGFLLIGHSQGSKMLTRLIADEIDGKPEQARLIGAIIPGTEVEVPDGKLVGGSFAHVPLCSHAGELGCVIVYSTYPADRPMAAVVRASGRPASPASPSPASTPALSPAFRRSTPTFPFMAHCGTSSGPISRSCPA